MSAVGLRTLAEARRKGETRGITSVCVAHPRVVRAALRRRGKLRHVADHQPTLAAHLPQHVVQEGGDPRSWRPEDRDAAPRREGFCDREHVVVASDQVG